LFIVAASNAALLLALFIVPAYYAGFSVPRCPVSGISVAGSLPPTKKKIAFYVIFFSFFLAYVKKKYYFCTQLAFNSP